MLWAGSVFAALPDITDKPAEAVSLQPALVVTAFSGGAPDFFEVYNQSTQPVNMAGWSLEVLLRDAHNQTIPGEESVIMFPAGWLLPKQYLMLQRASDYSGDNQAVNYYTLSTGIPSPVASEISLKHNNILEYTIAPSMAILQDGWVQHRKRTAATLKISHDFLTDYTEPKSTIFSGYADMLYVPPASTGLQILEILPNARDCSPLDISAECGDYIKLYNPTGHTIDMSVYRLRTDSGGIKSSATNTVTLSGDILPGAYYMVQTKDNGEKLSITNTGGFVWLEDSYGVVTYDQSVTAYPDASPTRYKGMSWALQEYGAENENSWQWMVPRPGVPNIGDTPIPEVSAPVVSKLADCGPGKERNPATNRCRTIASAGTSLVPCKPGQMRNPETNRCRSATSVKSLLQACGPGKYRNPETNRCKNIASAKSGLTPCKPGQERNPETNRCRKAVLKGKDIASVTDNNSTSKATKTGWWVATAGVLLALSYGIFEWRQDIVRWFQVKIKRNYN